jgi:hypothetical protein
MNASGPSPSLIFVQATCAIFALIIGALGVQIAQQQHKTAAHNLRLSLYQRRYEVYRGLMDLFAVVFREVGITRNDLAAYHLATDQKRFLFKPDLVQWMKQVSDKALDLRHITRKISPEYQASEEALESLTRQEFELVQWFEKQADEAAKRFEPYLGFYQDGNDDDFGA